MKTDDLRYCDVLKGDGFAYVVVGIWWQGPVQVPRTITHFTLLETGTLTNREVTAPELQEQLDKKVVVLHRPETVRRVKWS